VPIPHREIVLTSKIMDAIFDQLDGLRPQTKVEFDLRTGALTR